MFLFTPRGRRKAALVVILIGLVISNGYHLVTGDNGLARKVEDFVTSFTTPTHQSQPLLHQISLTEGAVRI